MVHTQRLLPSRCLVYFHGGGYVAGGLRSHGTHAAALAKVMKLSVLMPLYRLALELQYPAAVDDALTAYLRDTPSAGPGAIWTHSTPAHSPRTR